MDNQSVDCGCDEIPQPLLSTDKALEILTSTAKEISASEVLKLDDSLNRVLATDICSNINVPGFDNSAMDGYAIHLKDEQINTPGGFAFNITDRIPAGSTGSKLESG